MEDVLVEPQCAHVYRGLFCQRLGSGEVQLFTHLHLVVRFMMH
jgi:hypothetical protein